MEKYIGTESFGLNEFSIVADDGVEISILTIGWSIGATAGIGLPHAAGAMNKSVGKSTIVRLIGFFISQVPFSENPGGVSRVMKRFSQRDGIERHTFTFEDGMSHSVFEFVATGHDGRSSWCASWADVEVAKAKALCVEPVDVWCTKDLISQTRQIAFALVIGHHHDDIRPSFFQLGDGAAGTEYDRCY